MHSLRGQGLGNPCARESHITIPFPVNQPSATPLIRHHGDHLPPRPHLNKHISPTAATAAPQTDIPEAPPNTTPPPPTNIFPDITLPLLDPSTPTTYDLVIAGAGPAGLSVAERVSSAGFSVVIVDPNPLSPWINNYGVWCDEFEVMGLDDCYDVVWDKAVVYLDAGETGKRSLRRPYARVDRPKLKRRLLERCIASGVKFHLSKVENVDHGSGKSTLRCEGGVGVAGQFSLDATGQLQSLLIELL